MIVRLLVWWMLLWTDPTGTSVTVRFEGIRYPDGFIFVGLYENQESWDDRLPSREINFEKAQLQNGILTGVVTGLRPGKKYGLAVLDDANGNNVVDMGFLFPLEGFGFSNFQVRGFRLPRFEDFAFDNPTADTVVVKMRYLDF